jgi:NitT/TauT family transport system substrate-binding protein
MPSSQRAMVLAYLLTQPAHQFRRVMFTRVKRVCCYAVTAAAVALPLCSCSGSAASPGKSGTISITVGALPVVDDVSAYIAADDGIFQRLGLNVTLKEVLQSTLAIPEMKKGTIDIIGGGNYVSFIKASAVDPADPPFRILAEAAVCAPNSFDVLVLPSSGIQTPAELQHKTIAVNLANNIQTLTINSVLKADNVNPGSVRYVVIPFPKMAAALKAHQVDAISEVEPFATQAQQSSGAQALLDQCSGPTSAIPLSGYFSTSSWAQHNPEAVSRFQQAIAQAQEIADTDRAEVEKVLLTYVPGLTPVEAATISLDEFPLSTDSVQLNRVSELMLQAGLLPKPFQASALIQG